VTWKKKKKNSSFILFLFFFWLGCVVVPTWAKYKRTLSRFTVLYMIRHVDAYTCCFTLKTIGQRLSINTQYGSLSAETWQSQCETVYYPSPKYRWSTQFQSVGIVRLLYWTPIHIAYTQWSRRTYMVVVQPHQTVFYILFNQIKNSL
jgi:hypothetical protein